jgi:hypothetical protein
MYMPAMFNRCFGGKSRFRLEGIEGRVGERIEKCFCWIFLRRDIPATLIPRLVDYTPPSLPQAISLPSSETSRSNYVALYGSWKARLIIRLSENISKKSSSGYMSLPTMPENDRHLQWN